MFSKTAICEEGLSQMRRIKKRIGGWVSIFLSLYVGVVGSSVSWEEVRTSSLHPSPVAIEINKKTRVLSIAGLSNLEIYGLEGNKKKDLYVRDGKKISVKRRCNQRYSSREKDLTIDFSVDESGNIKIWALHGSRDVSFTTPRDLVTEEVNSSGNILLDSRVYENLGLFSFGENASIVTTHGILKGGVFRGDTLALHSTSFLDLENIKIKTLRAILTGPSVLVKENSEIISTTLEVTTRKFGIQESRVLTSASSIKSSHFFLNQGYFHVDSSFVYEGESYRATDRSGFRGESGVIFSVHDFENRQSSTGSRGFFHLNIFGGSDKPLLNQEGRLYSLEDLFIQAPLITLSNTRGAILSRGEMELTLKALNNRDNSVVIAKKLTGALEYLFNLGSRIRVDNLMELSVTRGVSNSTSASIHGRKVNIQIGEKETAPILENKDSHLNVHSSSHATRFKEDIKPAQDGGIKQDSPKDRLYGNFINELDASVIGTEGMDIKVIGEILNEDGAKILSPEGSIYLEAQSRILNHDTARIFAGKKAHLKSAQGSIFNNDGGHIQGCGTTMEAYGRIDNTKGVIESFSETSLWTDNLNNAGGKILSVQDSFLPKVTSLINFRGILQSAEGQVHLTESMLCLANERGTIKSKKALSFRDLRKLKNKGGQISPDDEEAGGLIESAEQISFRGIGILPSFLGGAVSSPILEFEETHGQAFRTLEDVLGYKDPHVILNCDFLRVICKGVLENDSVIENLPYNLSLDSLEFYNRRILKTKKNLKIQAKTFVNAANLEGEDKRVDNCFPFLYLKHAQKDSFLSQVFRDLEFRFVSQEKSLKAVMGAEELSLVGTETISNYGRLESINDSTLESPNIQNGWAVGDEETEFLVDGEVRRDAFDWKHHVYKPQPNCYLNVGGKLFIKGVRDGKFLSTFGLTQVRKGVSVENLRLFLNFAGAFHVDHQPAELEWRVPYFLNMLGIIDTSIVAHRYWQIDYANSNPAEFVITNGALKLRDTVYALNAASFLHAQHGIDMEGISEDQKKSFLETFKRDASQPIVDSSVDFPTKVVNENYVETYVQTLTKTGVDVSVQKHSTLGIGSKSKSYTYWRLDYPESGTRDTHFGVMSSGETVDIKDVSNVHLKGSLASHTIGVKATGDISTGDQRDIKMPSVKVFPDSLEIMPEETHSFDQQIYKPASEDSFYVMQTGLSRNSKEKVPMVIIGGEETDIESYKMLLAPEDMQGLMIRLLQRKMNTGYIPSLKTMRDAAEVAYSSALTKDPEGISRKKFAYLPQETSEEKEEELSSFREVLVISPEQVEEGLYFVPKILKGSKCLVPVLHFKKDTVHPDLGRPDGANIAEGKLNLETKGDVDLGGTNIGKKGARVRGRNIRGKTSTYAENISVKETYVAAEGGFLSSSSEIREETHHQILRHSGLPAILASEDTIEIDADKDVLLTGMNLMGGDISINGWRVLLNTLDLQDKKRTEEGQEIIVPTYKQTIILGGKTGHITTKVFENHGSYYLTIGDSTIEAEYEITQDYVAKTYRHSRNCRVKQSAFSATATESELYQTAFSAPELGSMEGTLKLISPLITAEGIVKAPEGDLIFKGVTLTGSARAQFNKQTSKSTKKTGFGGAYQRSTTEAPQFLETTFEGRNIHVETETADFAGTTLKANKLKDLTAQGMTLRPTVEVMVTRSDVNQSGAFGTQGTRTEAGQEVEHRSILDVKEMESVHVPAQFTNVDWDRYATLISGLQPEETVRQLNSWVHTQSYSTGIGQEGAIVVALAVTVATGGTGSGIWAVMGNAAFSTLCSSAAITFLNTGGDLQATCKSLASVESLKSVIIAAASAGVVHKLAPELGVVMSGANMTIGQHAARAALLTGTQTAVTSLVNQEAPDLSQAARLMVANVVQGYAANKLGSARAPNQETGATATAEPLDGTTHKILHAAVGAVAGAILDPHHMGRGALAGAIGASVAEAVAEGLTFKGATDEEIQRNANTGKILAGIAALAVGQDVGISIHSGTTAIENNFLSRKDVLEAADSLLKSAEEIDWVDVVDTVEVGVDVATLGVAALAAPETAGISMATRAALKQYITKPGFSLAKKFVVSSGGKQLTTGSVKHLRTFLRGMKQETTGTSILKPRTRTMAEDVKVAVVREPVKTSGRVESGSGNVMKSKVDSKSVSRSQRWLELAQDKPNKISSLPKEVKNYVKKSGGRNIQNKFGLELAHKPKKAAAQGHDYSEALPKYTADHRGIQHRFLKESREGTVISKPKASRDTNKYSLPKAGALSE